MQPIKLPVKVELFKSGEMIYYSQLDLVYILERALRRSGLPVYFTQGFNPHIKMSFYDGLKLGVEGKMNLTFYFTENVTGAGIKDKLTPQLPAGLAIEIPY